MTRGDRPGPAESVTPSLLRSWSLPDVDGDKDAKGRLVVVGGSVSTPGAVILAAEAALRVGAGKVQVVTSAATAALVAVAVPEVLVVGLDAPDGELSPTVAGRILQLTEGADAVLVGCGFGDPERARDLLEALTPSLTVPLVVDALGTAYLTAHPGGVRHLAGTAVLTPNLTELAEVLGEDEDGVAHDLLDATRRAAALTGATVLSGAAVSYVAEPTGAAWAVDAGAPGAAVAGSGDVKAGAVAGLLARGVEPARAAAWGSYVHARAGERLTASVGRVGFLAREVSAQLPVAMGEVLG